MIQLMIDIFKSFFLKFIINFFTSIFINFDRAKLIRAKEKIVKLHNPYTK